MTKTIFLSRRCDTIKKFAKINDQTKHEINVVITTFSHEYNRSFDHAIVNMKSNEAQADKFAYKRAIRKLPKWAAKKIYNIKQDDQRNIRKEKS